MLPPLKGIRGVRIGVEERDTHTRRICFTSLPRLLVDTGHYGTTNFSDSKGASISKAS